MRCRTGSRSRLHVLPAWLAGGVLCHFASGADRPLGVSIDRAGSEDRLTYVYNALHDRPANQFPYSKQSAEQIEALVEAIEDAMDA